jgi:hypothetical protein
VVEAGGLLHGEARTLVFSGERGDGKQLMNIELFECSDNLIYILTEQL